eukprot:Awhi_evm1s15820
MKKSTTSDEITEQVLIRYYIQRENLDKSLILFKSFTEEETRDSKVKIPAIISSTTAPTVSILKSPRADQSDRDNQLNSIYVNEPRISKDSTSSSSSTINSPQNVTASPSSSKSPSTQIQSKNSIKNGKEISLQFSLDLLHLGAQKRSIKPTFELHQHLFTFIEKNSTSITNEIFDLLIDYCIRQGALDPSSGKQVFKFWGEQSLIVMLKLQIYPQLEPSLNVYQKMINLCEKHRQFETAFKFFDQVTLKHSQGISCMKPTLELYNQVLGLALKKNEHLERAVTILNLMKSNISESDIIKFPKKDTMQAAVIGKLLLNQEFEKGFLLFRIMKRENMFISGVSYRYFLTICQSLKDVDKLKEVIEWMHKSSFQVTPFHYHFFIGLCDSAELLKIIEDNGMH